MEFQTESSFRKNRNQYIAAITANLVYMGFGTMIGSFATAAPLLLSNETPLKSGPLTNEQLSNIGSINALASIASSLAFGFIAKIIGCKRTILLLAVPSIIFFVLIYIGDTYHYLVCARLTAGMVGGGIQTVLIIFIAEIADDKLVRIEKKMEISSIFFVAIYGLFIKSIPQFIYLLIFRIRGKISTISHMSRNVGILIAYDLGSFLPYRVLPCIFIFIPIVFAVLFVHLPNTPSYYIKRGNLVVRSCEFHFKFRLQ